MSRFVHPETCILSLADGATLVVKRRLNTGERRRMSAAMSSANGDGTPRFDRSKYPSELVVAYLLDWSLTDDGRPVPIRDQPEDVVRAALDQLDYDDFTEIFQAIEAHITQQTAAREAEKKTRSFETGSPMTSPSPPAMGGGTNG